MLFTGLRNQALTKIKVKNVLMDKELLHYDAGIINSKHKIQFFPLPPKLFKLIKEHIKTHNLQPEDTLLFGMQGLPLQNKQLNRITDKICERLGWINEHKVTPHGFRATIATLLDERGISIDAIKYLLGHSNKDNVNIYLRRDKRKIHLLRKELTKIEEELEASLTRSQQDKRMHRQEHEEQEVSQESEPPVMELPKELLLEMMKKDPELALSLIEKGYGK
jgi:integrase